MDPTALLWVFQIAASHGTFRVILHFGTFRMSISNYECTIACDRCRAHPGNDSTLKRYAEIPLVSLKERELLVSSLTAAARKPSICPLSKDSIVPSSLRRESELKRSSPVGQRLRRWALGRCLKPHGGEEARHRASLCGSWTLLLEPCLSLTALYEKVHYMTWKTHQTVRRLNRLNGLRQYATPYLVPFVSLLLKKGLIFFESLKH